LGFVAVGCSTPSSHLEVHWSVPEFSLPTSEGTTLTSDDLKGEVWVASFIFTRCKGPCPVVTSSMHRLQTTLADQRDFRLVTITVDPDHDTASVLDNYARGWEADSKRWYFLTGDEKRIYSLIGTGFKLGVEQTHGSEREPGNEVTHSTKLALVDRQGRIRGFYDSRQADETGAPLDDIDRLERDARLLLHESEPAWTNYLPMINALLNALSAALIIAGFAAVLTGRINLHKTCMTSAFLISTLFILSYLFYHLIVREGQVTRFRDMAPEAPRAAADIYRAILSSHTVLAILGTPLVIATLTLGWTDKLIWHMRLARWTLPIWLYVSVTGVVVYVMLYRLYTP
jgi:protein SCO1/2/putative membrane protein